MRESAEPATRGSPVKVLLISEAYFPPQVGGISRLMQQVASSLGSDRVCCLTSVASTDTDRDDSGLRVYRYPSLAGQSRLGMAVGWIVAVATIMVRERPRVVILGSVVDSHFALWLHRWLHLPFVVFGYGNEILDTINHDRVRQRRALAMARRVLVTSRYSKAIAEEAGASPERTTIVLPGCDTAFFRPRPPRDDLRRRLLGDRHADRVILTVGNLVARKGHDMVIRALPRLSERVPNVVYAIAGDGPYRAELETLATNLGVRNRVVFVGRIADDDLPDLYALSDVFIMASRERRDDCDVEGFGIVLLEASACGKPVIGGRSGGVPDAVAEGVSGLLVDPLSPEDIADALSRVLLDDDFARRLGEQGRLRVERDFQWRDIGERLLAIVGEVQDQRS